MYLCNCLLNCYGSNSVFPFCFKGCLQKTKAGISHPCKYGGLLHGLVEAATHCPFSLLFFKKATAATRHITPTASVTSTPTRQSSRKFHVDNTLCNHSDIDTFDSTYGSGGATAYFKEQYLAAHPYFPHKCGECKRKFCLKKKSQCSSTEWSAKDGRVRMCKIGANSERNDCCYALCGDCSDEKNLHTPRVRTRVPSRRVTGSPA